MAQWDTWRLGWIALSRAHKDKRSRKYLRRLLLMICAPLLAPLSVLLLFTPGGIVGAWGGLLVRRRKKRKETERLAKLPPKREPPPPLSAALRREFAEVALLHAVFADRAGSEAFLVTKILPEGIEVITRRVQLDALRGLGLYERLGSVERNLLILPDGHWTTQMISDLELCLEPVRLLRWALRVDHYLPNTGECLAMDYKLSNSVVKQPDILFRGEEFIGIDAINNAFRSAESYINRCFAEGVVRGIFAAKDEEQAAWSRKIVEDFGQREDKDLLLGTCIVSKADDFTISRARMLASRRSIVLRWIAQRMYGDIPPNEELQAFFLR